MFRPWRVMIRLILGETLSGSKRVAVKNYHKWNCFNDFYLLTSKRKQLQNVLGFFFFWTSRTKTGAKMTLSWRRHQVRGAGSLHVVAINYRWTSPTSVGATGSSRRRHSKRIIVLAAAPFLSPRYAVLHARVVRKVTMQPSCTLTCAFGGLRLRVITPKTELLLTSLC